MSTAAKDRARIATCLSQVPLQYREQVRSFVEGARKGYIKGTRMPGKGSLRIRVLVYQNKEPELQHSSVSTLESTTQHGYLAPVSFVIS